MGNSFNRKPFQLGIVVKDIDRAVEGWLALGAGPFFCAKALPLSGWVYQGEAIEFELDIAVAYLDDMQIEIMSPPTDAKSPYRDFIDGGGDGLHHLAFLVDTVDNEAGRRDGTIICRGEFAGIEFAYVEGGSAQGPLAELVTAGPMMDAVSRRLKVPNWDGSDPIRDMSAASYEDMIVNAN